MRATGILSFGGAALVAGSRLEAGNDKACLEVEPGLRTGSVTRSKTRPEAAFHLVTSRSHFPATP